MVWNSSRAFFTAAEVSFAVVLDYSRMKVEGGRNKSRSRKALRDFAVYPSKGQRKRQELLREWHGLKEPPSATKNLKQLQELVPDLMGALGLEERCAAEEMNRIWRELVGDFNAPPDAACLNAVRREWTICNDLNPEFSFPADLGAPSRKLKRSPRP